MTFFEMTAAACLGYLLGRALIWALGWLFAGALVALLTRIGW